MKRWSYQLVIIVALCASALAAAFVASGKAAGKSDGAAAKQFVVGFSNPTGAQPILQTFQKSLVAAGKHLNIKVVPVDAQLNVQKQVSDINQMVAQHVDGIVVFPLAPNTLTPALNRARKAGIKILGFNAVVQKPKAGASIAPYDANFDQGEDYQGAKMLAQYVSKQFRGSGNVLGIGISVPVPSLHFMVKQYQSYLKQLAPKLKWLETASNPTDDIAGGEKVASEAATRYQGKINAVMAYNDDSAIGAAIALRNAGVQHPVIVGQNGDPQGVTAIRSGQMSAMVDIVPWREALVAATMMNDLLTGKKVPNWVATPVVMYTKSNIGTRLDWNKALQRIASGTLSCQKGGGCPSSIMSGH
ncbi:MAG TPA: sugar ABC transporter substrate-binding protein [Gaiellaceae bacterium]|nr:sugar ABC transporter substrate-binding protein [Gaiellaceae bacterium]